MTNCAAMCVLAARSTSSKNAPTARNSNRGLSQQPPIDPRLRALDGHRADGFCIVCGGAYAPDDRVAEALLPHGLEAGEQEAGADADLSRLRRNTSGAEEIATRRVVARKANDPALPDRDEAGDGLAREGNLGLAGPACREILPHPGDDLVFLGRQRAPYLNPLLAQSRAGSARVGQVIKLYEHVHGRDTSKHCPFERHQLLVL